MKKELELYLSKLEKEHKTLQNELKEKYSNSGYGVIYDPKYRNNIERNKICRRIRIIKEQKLHIKRLLKLMEE